MFRNLFFKSQKLIWTFLNTNVICCCFLVHFGKILDVCILKTLHKSSKSKCKNCQCVIMFIFLHKFQFFNKVQEISNNPCVWMTGKGFFLKKKTNKNAFFLPFKTVSRECSFENDNYCHWCFSVSLSLSLVNGHKSTEQIIPCLILYNAYSDYSSDNFIHASINSVLSNCNSLFWFHFVCYFLSSIFK